MAEKAISTKGFDRTQIEEIRSRIPIEDVISRYVRLKPSGKNLFGLCPFHKEDTPSFSVNPELQIFKCFGCGEGGDVFKFLEKIENLEFNEVLEKLAQEAGIELKYTRRDPQETQKYTLAKESHKKASYFYHKILTEHKLGAIGRNYIKQRKFTRAAVKDFQIGYAPRTAKNNTLTNLLLKRGYKKEDLISYGLSVERNGALVDKFVDRIMFPILDNTGNTIGFSGRITSKEDERPKYLNSPETILFQKRKNLFGFYQAKQDIRTKNFTILVEGQTDVISSWQMGIKNIVAPLGTGVTEEQIEKLKKLSPNIILAFDTDNAGIRAIMRASIIALQKNMNVYAAQILYGKDADECIKKDPKLWEKTIEKRIPTVSFFLNMITQKYSPQTLNGKKILIEKITPLMNSISDKITKEHHIKEISAISGIDLDILRETFSSEFTPNTKNIIKYIDTSVKEISKETYLLTLILQYHKDLLAQIKKLNYEIIQDETIKNTVKSVVNQLKKSEDLNITRLSNKMPAESKNILKDSAMRPLWTEKPQKSEVIFEFKDTIKKLEIAQIKNEITELKRKISLAEQQARNKDSNELLNRVNKKIAELEKLTRS